MTTSLRPGMPELPSRMVALPLDHRGYPVPFFVAWIDGQPDFRVADARKMAACVNERRCWLCGQRLGSSLAFVVGPMCAVNAISSEPPSHRECAEFAVRVCPFLVRPRAARRDANMPEEATPAAGLGIRRNPGVSLLWVTKSYRPFRSHAGNKGVLFEMGPPREVLCYAEGRIATTDEVSESFETGVPILLQQAEQEGEHAVKALQQATARGRALLGLAPLVIA